MISTFHLTAIGLGNSGLTHVAQASAERIVYCLLEGVLVTAFAALLLRARRRHNAGTRFAVWFSALIAIALLPLLSALPWMTSRHVAPGAAFSHAAIVLPGAWAIYLFGLWAAIATVLLTRVGAGLWQIVALRRSCVEVDVSTLDHLVGETLSQDPGKRAIALCVSSQVHAPLALGFTNPAIVIPQDLVHELTGPELRQILLHELAHLDRWDDWTNLAQKVVKALLFFHPAVWWIERKVSLEREMACDDAVLSRTASPRAYAECLAHLAEKNFLRRSAALAQAAVSRLRQTSDRVARILDVNRSPATTRVWWAAVPLVAAFAVACCGFVARSPKLVAFEDAGPPTQAHAQTTVQAPAIASALVSARVSPQQTMLHAAPPDAVHSELLSWQPVEPGPAAKSVGHLENGLAAVRNVRAERAEAVPAQTFLLIMQTSVVLRSSQLQSDGFQSDQNGAPILASYQIRVWQISWRPTANPPVTAAGVPRKVT